MTRLLSMVVCKLKINDGKRCREIAYNFDHHVDAVVQCGTHCPMEHIPGFTRSHWMPPSGKCLHCIALAAAKVINFSCKHKNTNKTQLLASSLMVDQSQKSHELQNPKEALYSWHWCHKLLKNVSATIKEEELAHILSYQTLSADKN